jgi:metal-responsive CopG/Arc/MetJ family transcriptional regulator
MKRPTKKVQITLPEEILEKIDRDISETFSTRSGWFLKLAAEELKRKENNIKKVIDLDI